MGSSSISPPPENSESKGTFRKPTNDAAGRNYRRRSPVAASSSSGEEARFPSKERRRDDLRDDGGSGRSVHGGCSDSRRYSSRSGRHDGRYAYDDERNSSRLSSRSHRESRGGHSDHREQENEYSRSREHYRNMDRHARDQDRSGSDRKKYDDRDRHARDRVDRNDKRDYRRTSKDHRSDQAASCEELRGHRSDTKRDRGDYHLKGASKNDARDMDGPQVREEEKKILDEQSIKDKHYRKAGDRFEGREESAAKKSKFSAEITDQKKGLLQDQELTHGVTPEQAPVSDSDLAASVDAAKVAALKAAELVNKNLVGTGVMTADQKKKLLWGSKKSNNEEETSRRWNTATFSDREQQEKFKKLMGVKDDTSVTQRPSSQEGKDVSQEKLQMDLEKQYTAGLRRRDGRTVGLGL